MVTPSGQAKILDFGLAKLLDSEDLGGIHHTDLTEVGIPYGTATYAAPEQARGERVDARADIFSTGVLLYEMLTGMWPFQGKTSIDVRHAVLHDDPVPLDQARPGSDAGAAAGNSRSDYRKESERPLPESRRTARRIARSPA